MLLALAFATGFSQEREVIGELVVRDPGTDQELLWFGCVNQPGFHWQWEPTGPGTAHLVLACEVTAYNTAQFHAALVDYVVDGLQHRVANYVYQNGTGGLVYEDATVRFALVLSEITFEEAESTFRLCYQFECMQLEAPKAPAPLEPPAGG